MSCNCSDNNSVNPDCGCAESLYENEYREAYANCPCEQTENTRTQCVTAEADLENLGAVTDVSLVRKGLKIFAVANRNAASVEYEARITYLAYATEIAAVMLQRQQASAIIDARKMIVDGAVGMVEMALERLSENNVVALDDERKAAMVSNLLVVLCGNRDAQPVVNSGSIY